VRKAWWAGRLRHGGNDSSHETELMSDGRAYDAFYKAGGGEEWTGGEGERRLVVVLH
jgi:hypothetical protein